MCVCRQGAVKGFDTAAEQRYPVPGSLPPPVHQHGQCHQVCQAAGKSSTVLCISTVFCISKAFCPPAAVYQHGQCHQVCQAAGKSSTVFCISKAVCHSAAVYQHGQRHQVCQAACQSSVAVSRPQSACHTFERERLYSFLIKLLCCCKETMCTVKAFLSCWLFRDPCIFSLCRGFVMIHALSVYIMAFSTTMA